MQPTKKYKVAGIGEVLWDKLPAGKQLGGATANFVFHAHRLGAEGFIASAVGNDFLGGEIIQYLDGLNLPTGFIHRVKEKETGIVQVHLKNGIPEFEIMENVAWDFIPWNRELKELAGLADAVCFGSLAQRSPKSRDTIRRFIRSAGKDCIRVFDINLRQDFYSAEIIKTSLGLATVLKLNNDELPVVAEIFSLSGNESLVLEKLIDKFGLGLVALTKGSKGSLLKTRFEESFLEAPKVEVKDTVGAGDAFTAALIIAMLNGKPLTDMHRAASEIAAFVCSENGATPLLPSELIDMVM